MSDTDKTDLQEVPVLKHVDEYLMLGREYEASDIHLATKTQPSWRRYGNLELIWPNAPEFTAEECETLAFNFLPEKEKARLLEIGDVDFAYVDSNGNRYRASVVKQRLGIDMAFRIINTEVRSMDDLKLPKSIKPLLKYQNGLILVTGAVGSGKSTTLAALVDQINTERDEHIITLEDPIEYIIDSKKCHVNQREVHTHTESFSKALRGALRQDPDVIMVGEMRDLETIQLAITAAETGHLVLGTLHTGSAARTLDRILDVFPIDQREQIRIMVSESIRGIISQQLVPNKEGDGRCLALELLVNNAATSACIREGKTFMLNGVMQTGKNVGMITMDDALMDLYQEGKISQEECIARAEDSILMSKNF